MSEPEDEAVVLVCMRVEDAWAVIPGSTKDTCSKCQAAIWISKASRKLAVEKGAKFLCMPCANKQAENEKDVSVEPITEEQWKEFRDSIERN